MIAPPGLMASRGPLNGVDQVHIVTFINYMYLAGAAIA
jgi:hypothetical protein